MMRHHLNQTCLDHGCTALSQLQQVTRVGDQADHDSAMALHLRRLDDAVGFVVKLVKVGETGTPVSNWSK